MHGNSFPSRTRRDRSWPALLLWVAGPALGAGEQIESVLISKTADTADVEIRFACPNRYLNHAPVVAASGSEIALMRMDQCVGEGISEATRPAGRALAALEEIEYSARGPIDAALRLRFDRPVVVTVTQSGDLRSLGVHVQVPPGSQPAAAAAAPLAAPLATAPKSSLSAEQMARAEARARAASQPGAPAPGVVPLFVLNLRSSREPIDLAKEGAGLAQPGQVLYVADMKWEQQTWHRLRLGFFGTEDEAHDAWLKLRARFPDSWVTKVAEAERAKAGAGSAAAARDAGLAVAAATGAGTLTDAQVAEILAQARAAVIDQDYPRALELATRVVQQPPRAESAEARELLGLAAERNGQSARAIAEYQRYLADYPGADGADRVRQRLVALTTARDKPRESIRGKTVARESAWDTRGGFSQYYRRNSTDYGGEQGTSEQSAIYSDADIVIRHSGERFDFASRATVNYTYDMSSGDYTPGNETRTYNLYVDVADRDLDWSARLGRQTLRGQGVLGRFDGALLSWQWAPSYRLNLLAGYPVYNADQDVDTSRSFHGISMDVLNLLDLFDVNVYFNEQEVDGINDRQAVGGEIRYFGDNRSLIGSLDYDYGYGELNSLVVLGNWTFDNRLSLNGTLDIRKAPFLITENALVDQPAESIQELLLTYSEGEIRQLALDRSGNMHSIAFGVASPISERFQVSGDVTVSNYDGTPASGGVDETADPGTMTFSYLSLIGSSLFREGDVSILGVRYSDSGPSKITALYLDSRFPVTQAFRVNPRLLLSHRKLEAGDATETLLRPGVRLLYRLGRHYQFDFDVGSEFGSRDSGGLTNNSTGYYVYAGYRADF